MAGVVIDFNQFRHCPRCDAPNDIDRAEGGACVVCGYEIEPIIDYEAERLNFEFAMMLCRTRIYTKWLTKEIFNGMPLNLLPGTVGIFDGLTWVKPNRSTVDQSRETKEIYGTT